jgi:signal transduction histidine kinase
MHLRRTTDEAVRALAYRRDVDEPLPDRRRPALIAHFVRARMRPPVIDVVIAGAFVVLTVAETLFSPDDARSPVAVVLGCVAMAALAWRRAFPLSVAALVVTAVILTDPTGELSVLLSLVLASFTVGAEAEPPRSHVGLAVIVVPFVAASISDALEPSDLAAALVFLVGPWAVGSMLRQRTVRTEEALARVEEAEREREREAAEAAASERTRIARELHDIVSHSISVVTIQTQAVRRRLGPDHAREAADLAAVEATAREAMAELRRLFGMLRATGDDAALAPQPGLDELGRLAEAARTPDVDLELRTEGAPRPLPPGVDLAAYRILQEGLTNALRHSGATWVEVLVRYTSTAIELRVDDDGRGGDTGSGGHGLVGVRERVALYDGRVMAGSRPGGGFRLLATLPLAAQNGAPPREER